MTEAKRITTGAVVRVEVEVVGCGSWGEDCTTKQVFDQACVAAVGRVGKAIAAGGGMRLVGTPKVTVVTSERE